MQFDYDSDNIFDKSEDLSKLEYEFSKLRKETGLLYENEYVQDFLENYHRNENYKGGNNCFSKHINKPFNDDIYSKEAYSYDNETPQRSKKKSVNKKKLSVGNLKKTFINNRFRGVSLFSRKYGSDENIVNDIVTVDKKGARGDLVISTNNGDKNTQLANNKNTYGLKKKTDSHELDFHGGYSSSDTEKYMIKSDYENRREINMNSRNHSYRKKDEKIMYYLDKSSDEEIEGIESDGEYSMEDDNKVNLEGRGLMVSNDFLSKIPDGSEMNLINDKFEKSEKEQLIKRIQSLEVIESSQKMLILETQNREQQHRIRCEELQRQLEYKETKLLLLNQDYESLKKDNALLSEEKEIIKKKYTEMESNWNQEYAMLYKYKVDYELLSKKNDILMEEKSSFITMIESDKERYRKMELNHQNLLLNLNNLEKRNNEIVERSSKLQEDNDSLSREYNKLFHKYTSLISEYGAIKKNEEKLNSNIVELQDCNKKLTIENNDIFEKFKFLTLTEKNLENTQEKNIELENEISAIKKERDILTAENKIIEKKIKTNEELVYELKNKILDYTLENQRLKKLIKETLIPILPESEHNSTIGHVLTVLNAKENSRFSVKLLEEEYLNNQKKGNDDIKGDINYNDIIETWKNVENPFTPKRFDVKNNRMGTLENNGTNSFSFHKSENKTPVKVCKSKIDDIKNIHSDNKHISDLDIKKLNKIAPASSNVDEIIAKSCPIISDNNDSKIDAGKLYKSSPDLVNYKQDIKIDENIGRDEKFEKGVNILTPRPLVKGEDDHTVPVTLPIKLENKIKHSLEDEENIPVIPLNDDNTDETGNSGKSNMNINFEDINIKEHENLQENEGNVLKCSHINDCVKMIDNYEKQILLLNVEKVQLESELAVLPRDNWSISSKEKEERDNIERRLMEIQNSIFKASSGINKIKEKQKYKDNNQ
ncbi:putative coiled coil [Cryptosporidium bovis]|uniref:putative coiled coil n=1 Tax=Cryptosporidium bovis TaxID=310047 RepID=UPI00351A45F3|nr:putative coiled coil [Cryptosporidium bovis]